MEFVWSAFFGWTPSITNTAVFRLISKKLWNELSIEMNWIWSIWLNVDCVSQLFFSFSCVFLLKIIGSYGETNWTESCNRIRVKRNWDLVKGWGICGHKCLANMNKGASEERVTCSYWLRFFLLDGTNKVILGALHIAGALAQGRWLWQLCWWRRLCVDWPLSYRPISNHNFQLLLPGLMLISSQKVNLEKRIHRINAG